MEKEQIIKALECCCKSSCSAENNADCPLINDEACACTLPKNALSLIREQEKRIEEVKAETVRKMQEAIKERCIKGGIYPAFVASTIDKVSREMLEGGDSDDTV